MPEKKLEMDLLLDFYGDLLTPRQQEICRYYCREDLSLQEIAEIEHISRAAVYDMIDRCRSELFHYEEVLHLASSCRKRLQLYEQMLKSEDLKEVRDLIRQCRDTEIEGGYYEQ